jgi:hypothetical protein
MTKTDKIYGKCDCCGKTITNIWDYSSEYDNGIKTYCFNCSFRNAYKRLSIEYLKPIGKRDRMTKKVQIELILRDMENSLSILREAETFKKHENIPGLAKRLEESAKTIIDMYSEEKEIISKDSEGCEDIPADGRPITIDEYERRKKK